MVKIELDVKFRDEIVCEDVLPVKCSYTMGTNCISIDLRCKNELDVLKIEELIRTGRPVRMRWSASAAKSP